ncbi:hypothetical protein MHYP_G00077590 [Metynnis hypsauchen]
MRLVPSPLKRPSTCCPELHLLFPKECINSSNEKVDSLLGREFLKQQSDSRQEKADILEMTVNFLMQQQQQEQQSYNSVSSTAASEGYSRCVQEAVIILSPCGVDTLSQRRLLSHFLTMQPSMEKSTSVLQIQSATSAAKRKLQPLLRSGDPARSLWTLYHYILTLTCHCETDIDYVS